MISIELLQKDEPLYANLKAQITDCKKLRSVEFADDFVLVILPIVL